MPIPEKTLDKMGLPVVVVKVNRTYISAQEAEALTRARLIVSLIHTLGVKNLVLRMLREY